MPPKKVQCWIESNRNKDILYAFAEAKTPTQVKRELGLNYLYLKPFLDKDFLVCLNPKIYNGRLYTLTEKAKKLLGIQIEEQNGQLDFQMLGWILASPKQRLIILKALLMNPIKRTSEEIRFKLQRFNSHLSRISTKFVLKELIDKGLVESELRSNRKRYYWISEAGKSIAGKLVWPDTFSL